MILHQTNAYDDVLFSFGNEGVEGSVLRTAFHPFEEADQWPAIQQYQDMLAEVPDAKQAALGLQAMSAWLLFSVARGQLRHQERHSHRPHVRARGVRGAGRLDRRRPARPDRPRRRPAGVRPAARRQGRQVQRLYPEIGGEGDDGDGFSCPEDSIAGVDTSDLGEGAVNPGPVDLTVGDGPVPRRR